jgi:1-deoxy-D-xylulose-5-phosphate reductoisomerase
MSRSVTVLGSTGSIGCNTVDLLLKNPQSYAVEALVARRNVQTLATQAKNLRAKHAVVADESCYLALKDALQGTSITCAAGNNAVIEAAQMPAEWVMSAIVGTAGLQPTWAAIQRGAIIALANKETIISGGSVIVQGLKTYGSTLLPVDSEHNAIFQILHEPHRAHVKKLILTASGGPFRTWTSAQMANVTLEQALKHPNWSMGRKITVDSSNLMNKGLEMIEASYIFGFPEDKIDILIHPQSIVHSLVAYGDGSVLAQLGIHDMRVPIAHTLAWPERMKTDMPPLDLAKIGSLTFETPDIVQFPALSLARHALKTGRNSPAILNAANESAVKAFINKRIGYADIITTCREVMELVCEKSVTTIEEVLETDQNTKRVTEQVIHKKISC